ncbi:MAG: PhzF family phenazine biosynthesis protein, partial [Deinococcales bacterium]
MATTTYAYELWDVFTDRPLGGNPLAVVLDARGLDEDTLQALAREFNLSETAFVLPSQRADARARFFTPARELPMAGHPTIGTAFALAGHGTLAGERARLELGIGVVGLTLEREGGRLTRVWMDQGRPERLAEVDDRGAVARALGLEPRDLVPALPLQVASAGVPFLLVPVRSLAALGRARLDLNAIAPFVPADHRAVLVFAVDGGAAVRARMFGEALGVVEDPATGSAHGPLGAYLAWHGVIAPGADPVEVVSRQGVEMGRPSVLHLRVRLDRGEFAVEVGGGAVRLARG